MNTHYEINALPDTLLLDKLSRLSGIETQTTVEILLYLAEVERRSLHVEAGYSSMFRFCTEGSLKYSEPAAMRRLTCARAVSRFPMLIEELLQKRLSLTTLSLVASMLTEDNLQDVVTAIAGKSRDEVERYRVTLKPQPAAPKERVRPLAVAKPNKAPQEAPALFQAPDVSDAATARKQMYVKPTVAGEGSSEPPPPDTREQRFELRFTVDSETYAKLREAQALLLGKYPRGAGVESVFEEALELLLEKRSPRRRHARRCKNAQRRKQPAASPMTRPSRHVRAAVGDEVYVRDDGRCTYVSPDGVRCSETADLELHHVVPFGKLGGGEASNIVLLCRRHNCHQAVKDYGAQHMSRFLNPL